MKMMLSRLPVGIPAAVVTMSCDKALTQRLRDFGLISGTVLTVVYRSPYGGVTALQCRGAVLAMRTKDLQRIEVCLL